MKKLFFILALLSMPVLADTSNNQALESCLKEQKYNKQNFNSFNFELAAKCHYKTVADKVVKENQELSAFLKANPHYGGDGSGWRKTVEVYSTRW